MNNKVGENDVVYHGTSEQNNKHKPAIVMTLSCECLSALVKAETVVTRQQRRSISRCSPESSLIECK